MSRIHSEIYVASQSVAGKEVLKTGWLPTMQSFPSMKCAIV